MKNHNAIWALKKLKAGYKVRHIDWDSECYLVLNKSGQILDEENDDGMLCFGTMCDDSWELFIEL